jgi:hypothetical protein
VSLKIILGKMLKMLNLPLLFRDNKRDFLGKMGNLLSDIILM